MPSDCTEKARTQLYVEVSEVYFYIYSLFYSEEEEEEEKEEEDRLVGRNIGVQYKRVLSSFVFYILLHEENIFTYWMLVKDFIYINILRGKKDATTFSLQACFVNHFTLHSPEECCDSRNRLVGKI